MRRLLLLVAAMGLLAGIACHPRAGSELWSFRRDGGGPNEAATAVTTDRNGNVYAGGYVDSPDGSGPLTVAAFTSSGA